MGYMKFSRVLLLVLGCVVALTTGCGKKQQPTKPKVEITSLQRKEALTLVSEAELAKTLRDYPRAEGLYTKATVLCPDTGDYWMNLGMVQVRLNKKPDAKKSYEAAADAYKDALESGGVDKKPDPDAGLQRVAMLALLGRLDEARTELANLAKRFPDDRQVKAFVQDKELDRMIQDPGFKGSAI